MDLLDLASRQRWSSLAARAVSHPEEIRLSDPSGLTPLHWCCFNRPPLSVIRAMLDNSPNDEINDEDHNLLPPLVCLADVHGTTPLHAACSSHASPEVIQALVDSHPPSILIQDEMGWTALHYLTGTAFASLSFSEAEGRDAIASVRMLIERETQCVECVDREGQTPIALLCEVMGSHHDPGWQFIRRRVRSNVQNDGDAAGQAAATISNLTLQQEDAAEATFWSLANILVEAMYHNWCSQQSISHRDLDHMPPYLHQMCVLFVPGDLIRYALARHPEQARMSCDVGKWKCQLPLHLVSRLTKHNSSIWNIIEANRKAAQIRDGDGMLPLQLALKAQRSWENGTGDILIAYPEALGTLQDLSCSMYHFILHRAMKSQVKGQQVQTVFRILRSRPDLVHQQPEVTPKGNQTNNRS